MLPQILTVELQKAMVVLIMRIVLWFLILVDIERWIMSRHQSVRLILKQFISGPAIQSLTVSPAVQDRCIFALVLVRTYQILKSRRTLSVNKKLLESVVRRNANALPKFKGWWDLPWRGLNTLSQLHASAYSCQTPWQSVLHRS